MNVVWILHRDAGRRAALARLAAAGESAVVAAPGDPQLDDAPRADVVLLGLTGDFEVELQFAHRFAARMREARVVLLPERADVARARALFDTLDPVIAPYPPGAEMLREIVRATDPRSLVEPVPLSQRPTRDALSERFGRWLADVELPGLLRILDPQLSSEPVLISGETGTGRSLLARYIHGFGAVTGGTLIQLVCDEDTRSGDLLDQIAAATARVDATVPRATLWLDGVDRLPAATQRRLQGWIEWTLPAGVLRAAGMRWIGSCADPPHGLGPELRRALGRFQLRIPALRDRPQTIGAFVDATAAAWGASHQRRPRTFAADARAALAEYPWPGNLGELEAVVVHSLVASSTDPIPAGELRLGDDVFASADLDDLGAVLLDDADESGDELLESFLEAELETIAEAEADDANAKPENPPHVRPIAARSRETDDDEPIVVAEPEQRDADAPEVRDESGVGLRRLVGAVAHEVRNPLTTIRTFAELFPDQHQDPEFREKFAELVGRGVDRIEAVVSELAELAELSAPVTEPVDIAGMLEELLEFQRETIHARRLVVLKELDNNRPLALGDAAQLRFAFEAMLRKCLEIVPERGDVYFASRHHETGLRGAATLRVLVRFHGPGATRNGPIASGVSPAENALEFVVAEAVVRAQGGAFAIQTADADETVLVLDLPAPA